MKCLCLLAVIAPSYAFRVHVHNSSVKVRRHSTKSTNLKMISPLVANIAAGPIMYGVMSANEYATHRWYQHAELSKAKWYKKLGGPPIKGGGHVEHHAETYDDMSLRDDVKWKKTKASKSLDADPFRGTAFTWEVSGMMCIQMLPTLFPIYMRILRFSLFKTAAIFFPSMFLHALVWNALHPHMHGLPDIRLFQGAPSRVLAWLRGGKFFKYLYQNHEGHHVVGGRGNYNVCCPGTDHLVGTYIPQEIWRPKVKLPGTLLAKRKADEAAAEVELENHASMIEAEVTTSLDSIVQNSKAIEEIYVTERTQSSVEKNTVPV